MPRTVEYVLFDLDGLMLDTERIYTEVTNNILAKYNAEMTWDIKAGLMGKPEWEAATHLLSFFPNIDLTIEDYLVQRDAAQDLLWPTVPVLPGVEKLVRHLHKHKIPIAIATGSRRRNLELKTSQKQDLFNCFEGHIACADDGVIEKGRGKPNPDIYLYAAKHLLNRPIGGIRQADAELTTADRHERAKGLVFEDAIPGMQSGKRAGMNVVWVPDSQLLGVEYAGIERADQTLKSIEDFVPEEWGLPPYDHA